jgi:ubiquinone/menaquinone biosynthesis C-methylase UbiE
VWTGRGFTVSGQDKGSLLTFLVEDSGWSDDLTTLHEANAGADHPIDITSRQRAIDELRRVGFPKDGTLLEVGCSSGYFLHDARAAFPDALIIGSDYVAGPLRVMAREHPTQPLLQFDLTRCPLPDACLDAVVALNVLEHIRDDRAAVRELHRILKPGGVAVIELPAGPGLYDVYDKALMHERRYSMAGARRLFAETGFRVERPTHIGFFLFPAFAAVKLRNKRHLSLPEEAQKEMVKKSIHATKSSRLMKGLMKAETWGARYVQYPFGIRCVLTAVR